MRLPPGLFYAVCAGVFVLAAGLFVAHVASPAPLDSQIENENTNLGIGVHYRVGVPDAVKHFEAVGFSGVRGMKVLEDNVNCNTARNEALDAAERGEGCAFWQGAWDYSANICRLWTFRFNSYTGDKIGGDTEAARAHCDN